MAATSLEESAKAAPRRGWWIAAGVLVSVALILVVFVYLFDHSRRDLIAHGVRVDGIAVGGLHQAAAERKLEQDLVARLNGPVVIHSGAHTWKLNGSATGMHVDVKNMVQQAVDASRAGSIVTRTWRGLTGGNVNRNIALVVTYSHGAVRSLTAKIRGEVNRAPRSATVEPSPSGLKSVSSQEGLTVENQKLGGRIEAALLAPEGARAVGVPTRKLAPAVTTKQLAGRYPGYIVVDRAEFRLRYYNHLKLSKTYEIAVGMEGLETPAGLYHIQWEQVNPPWFVPKKAWAGALAGTVVPPGPSDPLKARFMSFDGGAGIHGIDPSEYSSIGHDASHGCVRMRIPDVIALYAKSPVGTPVYII
jgi:lipoprotein-anchoring transpeptidase ErfK/SrfK